MLFAPAQESLDHISDSCVGWLGRFRPAGQKRLPTQRLLQARDELTSAGVQVTALQVDAHEESSLQDFFKALPAFDHLVSMVGETIQIFPPKAVELNGAVTPRRWKSMGRAMKRLHMAHFGKLEDYSRRSVFADTLRRAAFQTTPNSFGAERP